VFTAALVKGAARLAANIGIPSLEIGLTVVGRGALVAFTCVIVAITSAQTLTSRFL